jgi:hypothetical protein
MTVWRGVFAHFSSISSIRRDSALYWDKVHESELAHAWKQLKYEKTLSFVSTTVLLRTIFSGVILRAMTVNLNLQVHKITLNKVLVVNIILSNRCSSVTHILCCRLLGSLLFSLPATSFITCNEMLSKDKFCHFLKFPSIITARNRHNVVLVINYAFFPVIRRSWVICTRVKLCISC